MYKYYEEQLKMLRRDKWPMKIKITSSDTNTHFLDVNQESIPVLLKFLKTELHHQRQEAIKQRKEEEI